MNLVNGEDFIQQTNRHISRISNRLYCLILWGVALYFIFQIEKCIYVDPPSDQLNLKGIALLNRRLFEISPTAPLKVFINTNRKHG